MTVKYVLSHLSVAENQRLFPLFDCYREETPHQVTVGMPGHSSSRSINLKGIPRFAVNPLGNSLFSVPSSVLQYRWILP